MTSPRRMHGLYLRAKYPNIDVAPCHFPSALLLPLLLLCCRSIFVGSAVGCGEGLHLAAIVVLFPFLNSVARGRVTNMLGRKGL